MGVSDVQVIGVGKEEYNSSLDGMIDGNVLPWVEDLEGQNYPVWDDYDAVQRSTYFLNRYGELMYQFNITTLDPNNPDDYNDFINLILDYRSNNGPNVLRVSEDYLTIQSAINEANENDLILVDPGLYMEQINFLDKNISLVALPYSGFDEGVSGPVIIDGGEEGTTVTISGGQNQSSVLLGFEIQNGQSFDYGGGILINGASPTIDRNIIQNNEAGSCGGGGGGIAILNGSYPHIFGNRIFNNITAGECDCVCYFGGGIYVDSLSWPIIGGSVTLGNILYDNQADRGHQLYRMSTHDTTEWNPIYAHHNYFNLCPPGSLDVTPLNGWDLNFCHDINFVSNDEIIPDNNFVLHPNYPNPFNPITNIEFDVATPSDTHIIIFDIQGRIVEQKKMSSTIGKHFIAWDAHTLPSGLYIIKVASGGQYKTQKAILVK